MLNAFEFEDNVILKFKAKTRLWQMERGFIEVEAGTLASPFRQNGLRKGYVFHGKGILILDTIVETHQGAIGKSVERDLSDLFLMIAKVESIGGSLVPAEKEDLVALGYQSEVELVTKGRNLLDRLRDGHLTGCHFHVHEPCSSLFAFANGMNRLDILVAHNGKIVYKAADTIFVLNRDNVIFRDKDEFALSTADGPTIMKGRIFT